MPFNFTTYPFTGQVPPPEPRARLDQRFNAGGLNLNSQDLPTWGQERQDYAHYYQHFRQIPLAELEQSFDVHGRMAIQDAHRHISVTAQRFDAHGNPLPPPAAPNNQIFSSQETALDHNREQALRRAYGQRILEKMVPPKQGPLAALRRRISGDLTGQNAFPEDEPGRITDQERAFLVRDMIDNSAGSALAQLFLKMHGFASWSDLLKRAQVTPEQLQPLITDEHGRAKLDLSEVFFLDSQEKTPVEKWGPIINRVLLGGATVTAGVLTGGAALPLVLGAVGGMGGGLLGKAVAHKFAHNDKMREVVDKNTGKTRGMAMVEEVINDYLAVKQQALTSLQENAGLEPDANRDPLRDLVDKREGANVLGTIVKGFNDQAVANLNGEKAPVKEYWEIAARSGKWELFAAVTGAILGGGAAGALGREAVVHHAQDLINNQVHNQMSQLDAGKGVFLDADGDKIGHVIKLCSDHHYHFLMNAQDAGVTRIGDHIVTGYQNTASLFDPTHTLQLGSTPLQISAANLPNHLKWMASAGGDLVHASTYSRDAIEGAVRSGAEALYMPSNPFMVALLSGAITGGGLMAIAETMDGIESFITGENKKGYQQEAQMAIAAVLAANAQEREHVDRTEGTGELDKLVNPNERQASEQRVNRFRKEFQGNEGEGNADLFKTVYGASRDWPPVGGTGVVTLADIDLGAVPNGWYGLVDRLTELYRNQAGTHPQVSLVLAVDQGDTALQQLASQVQPPIAPENMHAALLDALEAATRGEAQPFNRNADQIAVINRGHPNSGLPTADQWADHIRDELRVKRVDPTNHVEVVNTLPAPNVADQARRTGAQAVEKFGEKYPATAAKLQQSAVEWGPLTNPDSQVSISTFHLGGITWQRFLEQLANVCQTVLAGSPTPPPAPVERLSIIGIVEGGLPAIRKLALDANVLTTQDDGEQLLETEQRIRAYLQDNTASTIGGNHFTPGTDQITFLNTFGEGTEPTPTIPEIQQYITSRTAARGVAGTQIVIGPDVPAGTASAAEQRDQRIRTFEQRFPNRAAQLQRITWDWSPLRASNGQVVLRNVQTGNMTWDELLNQITIAFTTSRGVAGITASSLLLAVDGGFNAIYRIADQSGLLVGGDEADRKKQVSQRIRDHLRVHAGTTPPFTPGEDVVSFIEGVGTNEQPEPTPAQWRDYIQDQAERAGITVTPAQVVVGPEIVSTRVPSVSEQIRQRYDGDGANRDYFRTLEGIAVNWPSIAASPAAQIKLTEVTPTATWPGLLRQLTAQIVAGHAAGRTPLKLIIAVDDEKKGLFNLAKAARLTPPVTTVQGMEDALIRHLETSPTGSPHVFTSGVDQIDIIQRGGAGGGYPPVAELRDYIEDRLTQRGRIAAGNIDPVVTEASIT